MITNHTLIQTRQAAGRLVRTNSIGAAIVALISLAVPVQAGGMHMTRPASSAGYNSGATNRTANRPAQMSAPSTGRPLNSAGSRPRSTTPSYQGRPSNTPASATGFSKTPSRANSINSNTYVNQSNGQRGPVAGRGVDHGPRRGPIEGQGTGHDPRGPMQAHGVDRSPRGPMPGSGHGVDVGRGHGHGIPDDHFRSHLGRDHEFHIRHAALVGPSPIFRFGGVGFRLDRPWPMGWVDTDSLYVDYIGDSYYLCNLQRPGVRVMVDVADCDSCAQAAAAQAQCGECAVSSDAGVSDGSDGSNPTPTLTRGQTAGQVVAMLGSPRNIVSLGMRQIYLYDSMRVTFFAGRLTDVR